MGLASILASATVYIVEIASTDMRGVLGCFIALMQGFGMLVTYMLGYWLNWWQLSVYMAILVIPYIIGIYFIPESPHWYFSKGRDREGESALKWLHGDGESVIAKEIASIKSSQREKEENSLTIRGLRDKSILKPFMISSAMFVFFFLSGYNIMLIYCNTIFKYSGSNLEPNFAAILVGGLLLISSFAALLGIARLPRKVILLGSMIGMCVCHSVLGGCFYFQQSDSGFMKQELPSEEINYGWLPPIAIMVFLFLGNGGYGSLIWVVSAEILPPRVRPISTSINMFFSFVLGFLTSKTFVDLVFAIGACGTFWLYASICLLGGIFTFIFIPETKGKTINEIQELLAQ